MIVSKRKRYLTGSDWVINTLDAMLKSTTCCGNQSQLVFEFDRMLDGNDVQRALSRFVRKFPVLRGHGARDLLLAPYWSIPTTNDAAPAFSVVQAPEGRSVPVLEQSANAPFRGKREYLSFQLVAAGERSFLSMTFDHRVFDARGAEAFLNLFQQDFTGKPVSGDIAFASTRALTGWGGKFRAGRNVNRRIIALSKSTPEALPIPEKGSGAYCYRLLSFTPRETETIYKHAYQEAGYLLESPFLLAVIIQAAHDLFKGRSRPLTSYLVPVTVDLRPDIDKTQEIFFNYVSYLFYQVPVRDAGDRKGLINSLKQQMYDQVKAGFPRDLAEASLLTRLAPPRLLDRLLHLPLKGKMATFAFSHLGKSAYQHGEFMQAKITNLFHMPRVPVPPGMGFFSNYFNGRLNIVMSFLDGLMTDDEIRLLESGIRQRFEV